MVKKKGESLATRTTGNPPAMTPRNNLPRPLGNAQRGNVLDVTFSKAKTKK